MSISVWQGHPPSNSLNPPYLPRSTYASWCQLNSLSVPSFKHPLTPCLYYAPFSPALSPRLHAVPPISVCVYVRACVHDVETAHI